MNVPRPALIAGIIGTLAFGAVGGAGGIAVDQPEQRAERGAVGGERAGQHGLLGAGQVGNADRHRARARAKKSRA